MEILSKRILDHKRAGIKAIKEDRFDDARFHLLQAAELLFKLANKSTEGLKKVRKKNADKLLSLAKQVTQKENDETDEKKEKAAGSDDPGENDELLVVEKPNVKFSDVAGLGDVKKEIKLRMIYPYTNPEKAEKYGIGKGGGLLLFGPPGTGKTLLSRAVAGEIEAAFFNIMPSKIMSKWVGEAEQKIEKLFERAKSHEKSVIFIDEIESLIPNRSSSNSSVMARVVPQILAELEGFEERENALLFIGATNTPWLLDPAVLRPGRFDDKVFVGLPDRESRREIFRLNLSEKFLSDDINYYTLSDYTEGYSGADIREICNKASKKRFLDAVKREGESKPISLEDLQQSIDEVSPSVEQKTMKKLRKFEEGH